MNPSQASFTDYYEALHLHPDADAAMVDQAYWHLARLYNTAIPTDPSARAKLDELNEAYAVLRTPAVRKEYDRARELALQNGLLAPVLEAAPVPLAVMAKQRPHPKKAAATAEEPSTAPRRSIARFFQVPPVQTAVSALAILVLGAAALVAGAPTMLVVALLVIGLTFSTVPLVRLPRMPRPSVRLPAIGAPGDARPAKPTVDPMKIRASTQASVARLRTADRERQDDAAQRPHPPATSG